MCKEMKNMNMVAKRKKLFTALDLLMVVLLLYTANAVASPSQKAFVFHLSPQPQQVIYHHNEEPFDYRRLSSVYLDGITTKPVLYGFLQKLSVSSNKKNTLVLSISQNQTPENAEGYTLTISANGVTIQSRDEKGLFYGCVTLAQLIEDSKNQGASIPACTITDFPDVAYRSIHIDVKHHLDSLSYYYDVIDRLAQEKINGIIMEFEDKLAYNSASKVGITTAFTIQQFAGLTQYARKRNIEISPLVQGLGHAAFILKHEEYKSLRDNPASDWAFDPLNPKTYELQFAMYKDAMAATPGSKYLHIGGDEVGDLGYSELSKKSGLSPFDLQIYWLKKVCDFAQQNNRIPIFWDDMLLKSADLYKSTYKTDLSTDTILRQWKEREHILNEKLTQFPKNCVFMRWNYDASRVLGNLIAIDWYKKNGLAVMPATSGQTKWPMLPRKHSNFQAIKDFSNITSEKKLQGILCTFWDDSSPHFETYWRGIYDFAFFTWHHNESMNVNEAHALFRYRFYGPALEDSAFNFQDLLENAYNFWDTALVNSGDRHQSLDTIDVISLPHSDSTGKWTIKYAGKIAEAQMQSIQYKLIKAQIDKALAVANNNKYALQIFYQLNELQQYNNDLIALLAKYDSENAVAAKAKAAQLLKKHVENYEIVRKNFEKLFSLTRRLDNPKDFIKDEHQHLANGSVNDDWMFVYELKMNEKIATWLQNNQQ